MKFPESWLREHVQFDADRATLVATLTAIGLEVEDLQVLGEWLDGVVVGEIVAAERHPQADRLQVCRVEIGAGEPLQIVCGAPNARAGLKAPLAKVGAVLPGDVAIRAAALRGVESAGMLCSAKELGLDADASGLLELAADAPVGRPLAEHLGLPDARFELKLTPNRADCLSIRGIAQDVAAATGGVLRPLPIAPIADTSQARIEVRLEAGADCPRYVGRVLEDVDTAVATPSWMSERLKRSGIRPISLAVDVTQYVMLELGQPMHAFDADTLRGPVGVRRARAGEALTLLDGREATLDPEFLVITDADRPVALAGVMGGFDTRVTAASRRVFLEAAHFAPAAIIGRARRLGMHTDASHRFERGVDPDLPRQAIERATALILELAGGRSGPIIEAVVPETLRAPASVRLRRARLARVLGLTVPDAEVARILVALGMQVVADADGWQVLPPARRFDIAIEEDLIEEIARVHGYDRIPLHAPSGELRLVPQPEGRVDPAQVRQQLAARDWFEAINFAFVDGQLLARWGLVADTVALANPLSADLGVMRPALLPGLVQALARNTARQQSRVRLFELGRVFAQGPDAPRETLRVAAAACGAAEAEQWGRRPARPVDYYDLKGDLEALRALAGANDLQFRPLEVAWLHPGRSADVVIGDRSIGWIGHLHPGVVSALDLHAEVVGFEVDLEPLLARDLPKAHEVSRFPSIRRDIAVIVAENVTWQQVQASVFSALSGRLHELLVFDRYVGPGLETGFKSLAIGLILQDVTRTLTDQEGDQAVADALVGLARDCGAKLRS